MTQVAEADERRAQQDDDPPRPINRHLVQQPKREDRGEEIAQRSPPRWTSLFQLSLDRTQLVDECSNLEVPAHCIPFCRQAMSYNDPGTHDAELGVLAPSVVSRRAEPFV